MRPCVRSGRAAVSVFDVERASHATVAQRMDEAPNEGAAPAPARSAFLTPVKSSSPKCADIGLRRAAGPRGVAMVKKFPILPANPQRICWGCDRYCSAEAMACGNGSERTPHMSELFGEDWMDWVAPGGETDASTSAGVGDGGEDGNAGAPQDVAAGAAREERGAAPGGAVLAAKA